MKLLIPEHLPPSHIAHLRALAGVELNLLRISRRGALPRRLVAAAARRILPYRTYGAMRPGLERTTLSLSVDGLPLTGRIPGVEVLLANWEFDRKVAAQALQALPDVRWIHSLVTGVDHFDLQGLAERGVVLTSPQSVHAHRIAEFVMGLVYADAKRIPDHVEATKLRRPMFLASKELSELTLGIVGFGAIGQAVARLALLNGMQVVAHARSPQNPPVVPGVSALADILEVMRLSDVVVLALPLTDQTRGLITASQLGALKQDAVLVNVGRGETIVERDLVEALRSARIRRAFLDVLEDPLTGRPMFTPPLNHPLYALRNVVFTGYSSSESRNSSNELFADFLDNLARYRNGQQLQRCIDLRAGY